MTTIVGVDDIQFWTDDEIVDADDIEGMKQADAVSVTFRRQKNRDNGGVVTQHRTDEQGDDEMCPVRASCHQDTKLRIGHDSRDDTRMYQRSGVGGWLWAKGNLVEGGTEAITGRRDRSRGKETWFPSRPHRDALDTSGRRDGNVPSRCAVRDNSTHRQVEEQDIHEVPAHTSDSVDTRSNDEDDECRLLLHGDDVGQLGRKPQRDTTPKMAETRSTRAIAHKQTRNAKDQIPRPLSYHTR